VPAGIVDRELLRARPVAGRDAAAGLADRIRSEEARVIAHRWQPRRGSGGEAECRICGVPVDFHGSIDDPPQASEPKSEPSGSRLRFEYADADEES
jgi:hypothetical protein